MIDIVKIKNAAVRREIYFELKSGVLYCVDAKNGERVIVGGIVSK